MSANLMGAEEVVENTEPEGQPESVDNGIFDEPEQPEEQAEQVEETAESEAEEAEQAASFESLEQLAEATGMELGEFLSKVRGKVKIDGQEQELSLEEIRNGYQREADYRRKTQEVAEQRKQLEQRLAEADHQAQTRLQQLDDTIQLAARELNTEYQAINWQQLREEDPSEFSARQLEFQQRQGRLQQAYAQLQQERQQAQFQSQQKYQEFLQQEQQKLVQAIPEWKDEEVAKKERNELREYAMNHGYSEQDVNSIADHRQVTILRKAMLWDQLQKSKPEVENKVRRAPKIVPPGTQKAPKPKPQAIEDVFYSNS